VERHLVPAATVQNEQFAACRFEGFLERCLGVECGNWIRNESVVNAIQLNCPIPVSATRLGLAAQLSEITRDPFRGPDAVGVNIT
jgi:hypothetical protein